MNLIRIKCPKCGCAWYHPIHIDPECPKCGYKRGKASEPKFTAG